MAIHPGGDNLILGSYDKKTAWFDTELSSKPYKILRNHKMAVRSVLSCCTMLCPWLLPAYHIQCDATVAIVVPADS